MGEGKVGGKVRTERSDGKSSTRALSSKVVALQGLRDARLPLVIDDFHYLPRDLQGSLVRALKPLVFDGLPVAIIAIPHRRYDAMKVEREMTGRIFPIEIPIWSEQELAFIPDTGFRLLNRTVLPKVFQQLTTEAIGSPHLMQDFCRAICRQSDAREAAPEPTALVLSGEHTEAVFRDVAESIGRPIFEKLVRGPRQRTDRVSRKLADGREVDIYQLVLLALAHLRPGLVTLEYEDLRSAIRDVSAGTIPQLHARVLKHMAQIAATDQSSTPVVDFEDEEKKLHVTDPFFAFYLRWGDLAA